MGGGGDGGYQERQDAQDRSKQSARSALNVLFGVAPSGPAGAVDRSKFVIPGESGSVGDSGGGVGTPEGFDQAGYDAALSASGGLDAEAAKNKAALDALYGTVRTNAFNAGKRGLEEGKQTAGRDLKFELFARGLNGGSVDVDQNALLGRKYSEGVTQLGGKADSVANALRTGDENTRLTLLQSVDNGMDQGSAISSALAQMRNNSDRASAEAVGTDLGDLFGGAGLLYDRERVARGEKRLQDDWRGYNYGGAGSRGSSGITSRA